MIVAELLISRTGDTLLILGMMALPLILLFIPVWIAAIKMNKPEKIKKEKPVKTPKARPEISWYKRFKALNAIRMLKK